MARRKQTTGKRIVSETNWKELAVELAKRVRYEWKNNVHWTPKREGSLPGTVSAADEILTLAQPDEKPLKWPGVEEDAVVESIGKAWQVRQGAVCGSWAARIVAADTKAEAIAEWNRVVKAMRGEVDATVYAMIRDTVTCVNNCHACKAMWRDWLATHPENPTQE